MNDKNLHDTYLITTKIVPFKSKNHSKDDIFTITIFFRPVILKWNVST